VFIASRLWISGRPAGRGTRAAAESSARTLPIGRCAPHEHRRRPAHCRAPASQHADGSSVGEWSLLQEIIRADLARDLERDYGVLLNRMGLLDTSDEEAVWAVEQVYRAAAEQNRVEPTWDPGEGIIESVAVLVESQVLSSLQR